MKNFKKLVCIILAITCVVGLVGCSASKSASKTPIKPVAPNLEELEKKPNNGDKNPTDVTIPDDTENFIGEATVETNPTEDNMKPEDKPIEPTDELKDKSDKTVDESKPTNATVFDAKVIDVLESHILVEPAYGSDEYDIADQIYVETTGVKLPTNLDVDDVIRIKYNGDIFTDDVIKITTVYEVVKYKSDYIFPTNPEVIKPILTYTNYVVRAGWTDSMNIPQNHVYKLASIDDVNSLKNEIGGVLNFNAFDEIMEACDEAFFEENAVLLAYITANSGSVKYSVYDVTFGPNSVDIELSVERPEIGTCDMAGWFVMVFVPKVTVENCTEFNISVKNDLKQLTGNISDTAKYGNKNP